MSKAVVNALSCYSLVLSHRYESRMIERLYINFDIALTILFNSSCLVTI